MQFSRIGGYGNRTPNLLHGRLEYVPLHRHMAGIRPWHMPDIQPNIMKILKSVFGRISSVCQPYISCASAVYLPYISRISAIYPRSVSSLSSVYDQPYVSRITEINANSLRHTLPVQDSHWPLMELDSKNQYWPTLPPSGWTDCIKTPALL